MNRQLEVRIEERTQEVVSANTTLKEVNHRLLQEIAERERGEAELRVAATAFESQEGMTVTDANSVILRVNHAFTRLTGYSAEEAVGKNPRLLSSGRHDASFYAALWQSINSTGGWSGEIWNRRKNGEIYPEFLSITAVKDTSGNVTNYVGTFNDITMSKAAADEIRHLAFYDPLTRLPNRRLLLNRLQQALASSTRNGRKGALLFIDLDHFKNLNDTLGHDIGDLLLQQVAQRLESCVREGDTVARLGGDEFVVMLEDLSEQVLEAAAHAESVGEKILTTLNQPYQLATQEHHSTPSIGATLFSNHERGIEELMKQADIAMYQAKKAGRNALRFFDPQMQDAINTRATLERELRKALESRQFHLYYQIQVDSSHRPLGAEALIRWIHPERGVVSPAQFIPVAEETKLILPIGQWVLETACTQLKAWQQEALTRDLVLAVNVSAQQFLQADFAAQVQAAVQHHAINPGLLKLELTESLLLENIEDTIAVMNVLNEIGVRLSLDDFGTGYSSLQYLKRLPLDQLKIDQSFVRDIATDSNDKAIVRTIIAMAHSLNLDVIAEGVETEEQQQLLLNKGCTHYQGYLFSKPVPIEQFEALLK
jgi:diguanylate cyclase (GGDEF)-like protein/PAS domain S-box-containing protein